jgi:tRNA nucleotidyltransferase (CCA-adding enzyme)
MLRLIRYAARLGFRADERTAELLDPALMATVSGDRLGNELRLALGEPPTALRELERSGLGRALLGEEFRYRDLAVTGPLALAACCTQIPAAELRARLDHLGFPARERDAIVAAASGYERLRGRLDASDAELWRLLRRERPETVELLAAAGDRGAWRWLDVLRDLRLAITGTDLVAHGLSGAAVGEGLERAMIAMLEGRAPDRESQLQAALTSHP